MVVVDPFLGVIINGCVFDDVKLPLYLFLEGQFDSVVI